MSDITLTGFFDEAPGERSAMRLVMVVGAFVSFTVPGLLWILGARSPQAASAAAGASTFFGSVLAALLTAKVWQKSKEAQ